MDDNSGIRFSSDFNLHAAHLSMLSAGSVVNKAINRLCHRLNRKVRALSRPPRDSTLTIGYKLRLVAGSSPGGSCYASRCMCAIIGKHCEIRRDWWNDGGHSGRISGQIERRRVRRDCGLPQISFNNGPSARPSERVHILASRMDVYLCLAQRVIETGGVVNGEHEEEPYQGIPARKG
jgi:hypothetical protein